MVLWIWWTNQRYFLDFSALLRTWPFLFERLIKQLLFLDLHTLQVHICLLVDMLKHWLFPNNLKCHTIILRDLRTASLAARYFNAASPKATLDSASSHEGEFLYLFHKPVAKLPYDCGEWDHEYCVNPEKLKSMHASLFPWSPQLLLLHWPIVPEKRSRGPLSVVDYSFVAPPL